MPSPLQRLRCQYDGDFYLMDLSRDRFVHFTTRDRAAEIMESGRLLMRPPYKKFGIDAVMAVSTVWGSFVPGVQTTHIDSDLRDLVGVVFQTRTMPKVGYPEEVLWKQDVVLVNPKVVPYAKAKGMIRGASDFDGQVYYAVPSWCDGIEGRVASRSGKVWYHCGSLGPGDKFDMSHFGKGEGYAGMGRGMYFADKQEVAEVYCKYSKEPYLTAVEIRGELRPLGEEPQPGDVGSVVRFNTGPYRPFEEAVVWPNRLSAIRVIKTIPVEGRVASTNPPPTRIARVSPRIKEAIEESMANLPERLRWEIDDFAAGVIMGKAPSLEQHTSTLYKAFAPLRKVLGGTTTMYRGQPINPPKIERKWLSWTTEPRMAALFTEARGYQIIEAKVKSSDVVAGILSPRNPNYIEFLVKNQPEYQTRSQKQVPIYYALYMPLNPRFYDDMPENYGDLSDWEQLEFSYPDWKRWLKDNERAVERAGGLVMHSDPPKMNPDEEGPFLGVLMPADLKLPPALAALDDAKYGRPEPRYMGKVAGSRMMRGLKASSQWHFDRDDDGLWVAYNPSTGGFYYARQTRSGNVYGWSVLRYAKEAVRRNEWREVIPNLYVYDPKLRLLKKAEASATRVASRFVRSASSSLRGAFMRHTSDQYDEWLTETYEEDADEVRDDSDVFDDFLDETFGIEINDTHKAVELSYADDDNEWLLRKVDPPVLLYHHTTDAFKDSIRREGLRVGQERSDRLMQNTQAGVYLTLEAGGTVPRGYIQNAIRNYGGRPLSLTVRADWSDLWPDPDDADISSGRSQFVTSYVPPRDIVEYD
jgi:hypothetical protein